MKYIDFDMNRIIRGIVTEKEAMIYKAFEVYGFDKEYLFTHPSEFLILTDPCTGYEKYLYGDTHLFTFKIDIDSDLDTCKTKMFIEFFKKETKL